MKITFLGTGTSTGVPAIGCSCRVCRSGDPLDKRRRASLYVQDAGFHVVIDTPPDFREQALTFDVRRVDAVLFTHSHADHIFGFDDIRRFNLMQRMVIPAYGNAGTVEDLKRIFDYTHQENLVGGFQPEVEYRLLEEPLAIGPLTVSPLPVEHGLKATQGYLLSNGERSVAYVPDCHTMPESTVAELQGVDLMILNCLRHKPHVTHMALAESLALLERIGPAAAYLVHMGHDFLHAETSSTLPSGVHLAYDGLVLS